MIELVRSKKSDPDVQYLMSIHYTHPKGFVGRQLIYKIYSDGTFCGVIVGGSATLHLPGREEFFKSRICGGGVYSINKIIDNNFFHLMDEHSDRNLGTKVLSKWRKIVVEDWKKQYGDDVIGFESLVELPRTGALYKADNWTLVGQTHGYTCRRVSGHETGVFTSGERVWNTDPEQLKPKLVFCKMI